MRMKRIEDLNKITVHTIICDQFLSITFHGNSILGNYPVTQSLGN